MSDEEEGSSEILVSLENVKVKLSEVLRRTSKIEVKIEELGEVYATKIELTAVDEKAGGASEAITWVTRIVLGAVVLALVGLILRPEVIG